MNHEERLPPDPSTLRPYSATVSFDLTVQAVSIEDAADRASEIVDRLWEAGDGAADSIVKPRPKDFSRAD